MREQNKTPQTFGRKLPRIGFYPVLVLALLMVLAFTLTFGSSLSSTGVRSSPVDDPMLDPIPALDFGESTKAMVVHLEFDDGGMVNFESAEVIYGYARARIGDPPLLGVELFDKNGIMLEQFNAWHPLWAFEEDVAVDGVASLRILPHATGQFVWPFSLDQRTMVVSDLREQQELISVDLAPAIETFCEDNPDDPDCLEADVKIVGWDVPPAVPLFLSEQFFFPTFKTLHNNGPDGPVDVDVWKTMDVPAGMEGSVHVTQPGGERVTVPPGVPYRIIDTAGSEIERGDGGLDRHLGLSHVVKVLGNPGGPELDVHFHVPGVAVSVDVLVEEEFDLHCLRPGRFMTRLTNEVQPQDPNVKDPVPENNLVGRDVAAVCIEIDIKPGSDPNSINPRSQGTVPVAILSNPEFDAPSEVDKASLTFGHTGDEDSLAKCNKSPEDINRDGLLDLVCHFNTQDTGFQCGDTEGILWGQTVDGLPIRGRDSVRIVPCR